MRDITSETFGMLTALYLIKKIERKPSPIFIWRFRCECGQEIERPAAQVMAGTTKSCGCLKRAYLHPERFDFHDPNGADTAKFVMRVLDLPDINHRDVKTGIVLIGAANYELKLDVLVAFTGYSSNFIEPIIRNVKANEIYKDGYWYVEWLDEESGVVAFICDILVAQGRLKRVNEPAEIQPEIDPVLDMAPKTEARDYLIN